MLTPGDKAPAIALTDQNGVTVKLSVFKGRNVLVYFYPRADTPGCTRQACALRDVAPKIGDTAVLGISPDKPAALAKFDAKYSLGFTFLSDIDHGVAEAYGVHIPVTVDERIAIARQLAGAKVSMHQDIEKRRPLETDAIIGAVVELARKAGIATPMIDAVYALIAERAKHLDR